MRTINSVSLWPRYFALRALGRLAEPPLVGKLLLRLDVSWDNRFSTQFLREFVSTMVGRGEVPGFGALPDTLPDRLEDDQLEFFDSFLDSLDEEHRGTLLDDLARWRDSRVDTSFLTTFGHLITDVDQDGIVRDELQEGRVASLRGTLLGKRPRSILLVGRPGVGKSTVLRSLAASLQVDDWIVFVASASDVLANQTYMGELEGRVQKLLATLSGQRRVLWIVPEFHGLLWAGRHRYSPTSLLDLVQPSIEKGDIVVAGETDPEAYRRLLLARPRLRGLLETFQVEPCSEPQALALAREWWRKRQADPSRDALGEPLLKEALQLARQYLGDQAAPGNLLQLLELTLDGRAGSAPADSLAPPITGQDLLLTVSRLTGLPCSILDDNQPMDLAGLRREFEGRVLGQSEAVDCLVQRVAMVKAGLTDPTRPYGVFFFTGPTGTGKTELAKALAGFLFGSEDRMLRLDMSEFQTEDSLGRILGDSTGAAPVGAQSALVDQVRNQPFSVLLLDEFEKAHPRVWDLFLQLFDDGRLTDRSGNLADFRHTIVIMTSNLGGNLARSDGVGFGRSAPPDARRSLEGSFRKEFLNRIDQVVLFQPLRRSVMREILLKELDLVLGRRGLRNRTWAVEWEESAIDFLLNQGFTPDLGARPLKRAIEQYLLAPLALTMVDHQLPKGDQFLFVRSHGPGIDVVFVDPDAPDGQSAATAPAPAAAQPAHLRQVVFDARGDRGEHDFLSHEYAKLHALLSDDEWKQKKQAALSAMAEPAFWESPERFETLGLAEYMDRLEVGLRTAGSLLGRLGGQDRTRTQLSPGLLRRLAQQIYLVESACAGLSSGEPWDAFLLIASSHDPAENTAATDHFAAELGDMYRQWASRRGMQTQTLEEQAPAGRAGFHLSLAISGFAAYSILKPEQGLHVFEAPGPGRATLRYKVRVRVQPQPKEPARSQLEFLSQARSAFDGPTTSSLEIVRRYRKDPSPLVRDSVRNFCTGHLDRVLAGDFDLI